MKGIPVVFLLVLGLVAVCQAWKDYSPEDSEDYSSEESYDQKDDHDAEFHSLRGFMDNSVKYRQDSSLDDGLQDRLGFSDESMEYIEDAQLDELQELRGINNDFIDYPEEVSGYIRNRPGRGGNLSSVRKVVKSVLRKKSKTQQEHNNEDDNTMVESVVDDNLTYVTRRPLPAQDRNEPISKSLAEQVLKIMRNINGVYYDYVIPMGSNYVIPMGSIRNSSSQQSYFIHLIQPPCVIPMNGINCSSSYPALGRDMPYSSSQLTIKMDDVVNTVCSYGKSSPINKASTTASVTFSMSPEPHFIITNIKVKPERNNDFRCSNGSKNNPMDSILEQSRELIQLYLKESVAAVFYSLKRFD